MTLETKHLKIGFEGLRIIHDSSFSCASGTLNVLKGPNGSGKTTLLNALSGFLTPDSGEILYYGSPAKRHHPTSIATLGGGVVRSYQTPFVVDHLSVLDNVLAGSRYDGDSLSGLLLRGIHDPDAAQWVDEATAILKRMNLVEKMDSPGGHLSAGQRRRLDLSRAVFSNAQLLLLDEPLANLDAAAANSVVQLLHDMKNEGRTVLLIEHRLGSIRHVSDQILSLSDGIVVTENGS